MTAASPSPPTAELSCTGWASAAIERLQHGEAVILRPRGHSMTGKVNDGGQVTVEPQRPTGSAVT
jgi:hypothetical protein